MHSPVGALLQTVFLSICEVFIVAFAGYILARYGALDRRTQRQLNRLNIALFTPSLVFSKVAFTLSPAKFKELWIVPLFFVVLSFVSAAVAWGMGHLFRLRPSQRNFAIAASMFMNSNSLPIALLQSLVVSVPGLNWGEDDTTASKVGRALTYLTLCSTLGMVFRWSIGVRLLAAADPAEEAQEDPVDITEATPLLTPDSSADGSELTPEIPAISIQPSTPLDQPPPRKSTAPYIHTFPSTPIGSHLVLPVNKNLPQAEYAPSESDASDDDSDILSMGNRPALQARKRGFAYKTWNACKRGWAKFSAFMTAPLYASIISIAVALWPDLQHTLDVHLTPVKGAVTQLGNCSIPITLVVLGAYFFTPSEPKDVNADLDTSPRHQPSTWWQRTRSMLSLHSFRASREEKRRAPKGETRTVIVAIASRMIVVPALFLPLIAIGALRDVPPVFEDPVFILSLVLLLGSPPALTLSQMTQAVAGDAFERLISKTIFWSYCVFTPPLTVVLALVSMIIAKM